MKAELIGMIVCFLVVLAAGFVPGYYWGKHVEQKQESARHEPDSTQAVEVGGLYYCKAAAIESPVDSLAMTVVSKSGYPSEPSVHLWGFTWTSPAIDSCISSKQADLNERLLRAEKEITSMKTWRKRVTDKTGIR